MEKNYLENINKQKCKSCIFGPNPALIENRRYFEIMKYLTKLKKSHECHVTNKTCRGGAEVISVVMYSLGYIYEPTVEAVERIWLILKNKFQKEKTL